MAIAVQISMAALMQISWERIKSFVISSEGGRSKSIELSYAAALFLASIFSFFFFLALKNMNSKKRRTEDQPPGPWNLPILGSLHHILGSKLPHHSFRDLSAVHGPIMRLKLGEIPAVVISSVEGAREIMKTHDIVFATRPINKSVEALFFGGNDVIFGPYGEFWRQMRRLCTLELLSTKRVRSFRAVREEEVSLLIGSIAAASSGVAVNLSNKLAEVGNNVTARAVIGSQCGDRELFFSALGEVVELVSGLTIVDLFPSKPFIGRITGYQSRLEQCGKKLDVMLEKIVEEHAEKVAKNSNVADNINDEVLIAEDLTDVLLRVQREGSFQFPISKNNIKAIINDMLLAGSETSSTLMEWSMSELIRNPEIMKKAQREVREVIGSTPERLVEEEVTSGRLTYLQMVIKETLRLHPPVPLLLFRENQEICKVMGYEIPLKTTVMINMWAIARDAKYWDDPNIFYPERFEGSDVDFRGSHFEFVPFGAGRRMCPGIQFGLSTVELVLTYLLYYFDWEYLGKELDMEEAFGITTRRKSPLYVVHTLHFPLPSSA